MARAFVLLLLDYLGQIAWVYIARQERLRKSIEGKRKPLADALAQHLHTIDYVIARDMELTEDEKDALLLKSARALVRR
jgi:hypothetical protein